MAGNVQILNISGCSDGDGRKWPNRNQAMRRCDAHFLERIATDKWAKDLGLPSGPTYRLDRLPHGYAGYEKQRGNDPKHYDRYIYGHPKLVSRSLNEFYPHFKYLMEHSDPSGCTCKLCSGATRGRASGVGVAGESASQSVATSQQSPYFTDNPPKPALKSKRSKRSLSSGAVQTAPPKPQQRRKQVDEERTPDILRMLLDKLQAAGAEGEVDTPIAQYSSPDWRTGHADLLAKLSDWRSLPGYVPRIGELVLFVRNLDVSETLAWDTSSQTFRLVEAKTWSDKPKWEVGVVTQMPEEAITAITDKDLIHIPTDKLHNVIRSGFRVEPISQPNSVQKAHSKQHKYVPLHAIRPLALWKDCVQGDLNDCHATTRHALTVCSSFCLIGRSHFKGTWPRATMFNAGLYIGGELIIVGDTVRLMPAAGEKHGAVTDAMTVSAIRLEFVNLHEASTDDYDEGRPYMTCLHVSGRAYTLNPARSFDGIGKASVSEQDLPSALKDLGKWYSITDPDDPRAKLEIPFHRILGRCHEAAAINAWYTSPSDIAPTSSFQAVNAGTKAAVTPTGKYAKVSHGLSGVVEGRRYSNLHDSRINVAAGKTWYWADTRVDQLDLHEVNGQYVGSRDTTRKIGQVESWREKLRILDARQGGEMERLQAQKRQMLQHDARLAAIRGAASPGDEDDAMQDTSERSSVDSRGSKGSHSDMEIDSDVDMAASKTPSRQPLQRRIETLELEGSASGDDLAGHQLREDLVANSPFRKR